MYALKTVSNEYQRQWQGRRRAAFHELKLSLGGCVDCGYNEHPEALQFDHLPGSEKVDAVSRLVASRSLQVLFDEIAKCELVCANCHAVRTATRRVS